MSRNAVSLTLVVLIALIVGSFSASAQPPQPPKVEPVGVPYLTGHRTGPQTDALVRPSISVANAPGGPQVTLGQPGTAFRYAKTFGYALQPFISDTSHLFTPNGVGTDGTSVWIASRDSNRALKFTSEGTYQGVQIGVTGYNYYQDQTIWRPVEVEVDATGNIWLVDSIPAHVLKFDPSGNFLKELGVTWEWGSDNDHFRMTAGIAFDSDGNIYVSDGSETWDGGNQRIQIFDSGGNYLNTIGQTGISGSDNNHFNNPYHIAIDATDRLYIADRSNQRVQIFDVTNPLTPVYQATLGVTGVQGNDNGHFFEPSGVDVDASYIYVADTGNRRVQIFNRVTRAYVATIGTGSWGSGNYDSKYPEDVAVDASGNIYVADGGNDRVQQFNSSRIYVRTFGTTGIPYLTDSYHYNEPNGLAVAQDNSLYIMEDRGQRLVKIDANGDPVWTIGQAGHGGGDNQHFSFAGDIGLDQSGKVYVADKNNQRIQIFTSAGGYLATIGQTGISGTGNYQFNDPFGVAIAQNGDIYIADQNNHRIQIYDQNYNYLATMGITGVGGSDNQHFAGPQDVVIGSDGRIYIADSLNQRVQVFNPNRTYLRTVGVTDECADDFDHFCAPSRLALDAKNNLYVLDTWNNRVQVFDPNSAYLATIGGSWGTRTSEMQGGSALAVDAVGNVYIADNRISRIQKFSPGVPGWRQVNINAFGNNTNHGITTMLVYKNQLYAGTIDPANSADLWRMDNLGNWTSVMTDGFGMDHNYVFRSMVEFQGNFYVGTASWIGYGGEIWRSSDGVAWDPIMSGGFGTPDNRAISALYVFNNQLYASTYSVDPNLGLQLRRSSTGDPGSWDIVADNGFNDDPYNIGVMAMAEFHGKLYAGTWNTETGAEVWRSPDGETWQQTNTDGFGEGADNGGVTSFIVFNNKLYASTSNCNTGGQIWQTEDGVKWDKVANAGFGDINNCNMTSLTIFNGQLYSGTYNHPWNETATGVEVWRTADGTNWSQINIDGFGDSNNLENHYSLGMVVFDNRLFIGTRNSANGGEVWQLLPTVYLPLVVR